MSIHVYCSIVLALELSTALCLYAQPAVDFLSLPRSAEAMGKGGVYTSPDFDDPLAGQWNPAAWGFLAERYHVAFGQSQIHQGVQDSYVAAAGIGIGKGAMLSRKQPVTLAFGFSRSAEKNSGMIALSTRARMLRAAVGLSAYSLDVGALTYFPLHEWSEVRPHYRSIAFQLTPGIGYALLNLGANRDAGGRKQIWSDEGSRIFGNYDQDPRVGRLNISIVGVVNWQPDLHTNIELISLGAGIAAEDVLATPTTGYYSYLNGSATPQPVFGDLNPLKDLALSQANDYVAKCRGVEVILVDMIALRWGSYESAQANFSSGISGTTQGVGFKLRGLLELVSLWSKISENPPLAWAFDHVDAQVSYAIYRMDQTIDIGHDSTFDPTTNREQTQITVGIRM